MTFFFIKVQNRLDAFANFQALVIEYPCTLGIVSIRIQTKHLIPV